MRVTNIVRPYYCKSHLRTAAPLRSYLHTNRITFIGSVAMIVRAVWSNLCDSHASVPYLPLFLLSMVVSLYLSPVSVCQRRIHEGHGQGTGRDGQQVQGAAVQGTPPIWDPRPHQGSGAFHTDYLETGQNLKFRYIRRCLKWHHQDGSKGN